MASYVEKEGISSIMFAIEKGAPILVCIQADTFTEKNASFFE